nr:MAG TPA: hypothetical protein [Caudoviricetes sp.]DAH44977.1 MAG TPA: hypothetical protein [Caudoviricetes sp.]
MLLLIHCKVVHTRAVCILTLPYVCLLVPLVL